MTDLDLIIQAAKLGAAGSDNCNAVAAAIERMIRVTRLTNGLLKDYRKALRDGPENLGSSLCDELNDRADILLGQ